MTQAAIRIDNLLFDLELGRGLQANAIQDRISALCRTHLPGLLQRVVQPILTGETRPLPGTSLDRLELDLGELPANALESKLLQRLESALAAALARQRPIEAMPVALKPHSGAGEPIFEADAFLARGSLPGGKGTDAIMLAAMQTAPAALLRALRHWGRQAEPRHRIAHRLTEATIERLVRLCAPTDADIVITYAADLRRLHHSRPLVQDSEPGFGAAVWEFVLAYLLADRGSHFNTRTFVAYTLQQMASRYRIEYSTLLAEVAHCAALLRVPFSSSFGLPEILFELHDEEEKATGQPRRTATGDVEQNLQRMQFFLEHGNLPVAANGSRADVLELADLLLQQAPDQLRALIVHSGRHEAVRRRIAQHFGEALIGRIVLLLEPTDGPQIQEHLSQLRKTHAHRPVVPVDGRRFGEMLTELTLTTLLLDRGSYFNQRSFVRHLLQQMAASRQLDYSTLLQSLATQTPGTVHVQGSLLGILRSLNEEQAVGMQTASIVQLGGDAHARGLLVAWLTGANPPAIADNRLREWLTVLAQQEPDYLRRLLRAAGRRGQAATRLARLCDPALAQSLLCVLTPGKQAPWIDCLALLRVAHERAPLTVGVAPDAIFWEAAFEFLLETPNARMTEAYQHVGQALMRHYRIDAGRLLAFVTAGMRSGVHHAGAPLALVEQNRELLRAFAYNRTAARKPSAGDDLQRLTDWLDFGSLPDFATESGEFQRWLQRLDDGMLRLALRQCSPHAELLQRLLRRKALRNRTILLLCSDCGVSFPVMTNLFKLLDPRPAADDTERLLLAALMSQAVWQPGALLRNVLQALAPLMGASRQALLRQLQQALTARRPPPALRREMAGLVASAIMEAEDDTALASEDIPGRIPVALAIHFLREGVLPRWSSAACPSSLQRISLQGGLLPASETALVALREIADDRLALRRLLQYLSPDQLQRLLAALAPDFAGFVVSWLIAIKDLATDKRIQPAARRVVIARHREEALAQLLQHSRPSSASAILRGLGEGAAAACSIPLGLYWNILGQVAARRARNDARFLPLLQTIPGAHGEVPAVAAVGVRAGADRKAVVAPDPLAILRRYLRFGEGRQAQVEAALNQALRSHPEQLRRLLRAAAGRELERTRIVHGFSVNSLQQSLRLLLEARYAPASLCLAALQTAMAALAGHGGSARWGDDCIDELLFCLTNESNPDLALARFVEAAARGFRRASAVAIPTLRERALQALSGMRSQPQSVRQAAQRLLAVLPAQLQKGDSELSRRETPQAPLPTSGDEPMAIPEGMRLPVDNAGLVLLAPFLERYFAALDLLRGRDFSGPAQRLRATYLTQYLACGKQEAPEPSLLLNKILCGASTAVPLDDPLPLGEAERQLTEQLLTAVIRHWSKLGNTSIAGLRETFLMRTGYLTRRDNDWALRVEPGPYDVLLQSLPWSIATIRLPWMEKPLWVQWT